MAVKAPWNAKDRSPARAIGLRSKVERPGVVEIQPIRQRSGAAESVRVHSREAISVLGDQLPLLYKTGDSTLEQDVEDACQLGVIHGE